MKKKSVRPTAPRAIVGVVQAGRGYGEKIGAKTANLDLALAKDLRPGLYTCSILAEGRTYPGLLYCGINSLTNKDCLEAHLLDFEGDLYGKQIIITINKFIRSPKKFSALEDLAAQIRQDLEASGPASLQPFSNEIPGQEGGDQN